MNKEQQKKLIIEIMNDDAKDGLYKKQTAVEWLIEQIIRKHPIITQYLPNYTFDKELIDKAKEMEKQQIIDANEDASTNELGEFLTGEQYYNKEYGK